MPRPAPPDVAGQEFYIDELAEVPTHVAAALVARGLVWATAYAIGAETRGGTLIAADRTDALRLARERGLGETVTGRVTRREAAR